METPGEKGPLLRKFREKKGLSQRKFAELAGLSRGRLQRLENGQFKEATCRELERIAQVLGVEIHDFFPPVHALSGDPVFFWRYDENSLHYEGIDGRYQMIVLAKLHSDLFVARLIVFAGQRISSREIPAARTLFLQSLMETLHVTAGGRDYQVQEGDRLVFSGNTPWHLENPSIRDQVSLLIARP